MKNYPFLKTTLLVCLTFTVATIAQAQATRTWVSGVGDDLNPCSRTAPCRTWAGAHGKTAANGIINAVDPGSFGAVTVTKSITIDGDEQLSGTTNSLVNGITINDSASGSPNTIIVTLRNLAIDAAANGINGINFVSGKTVNVENCVISGNTAAAPSGAGIRVSLTATGANLNVKNTNIFKNRVGISATTSVGFVTINVNNCNIENHTSDGIFLDNNAFGTIRDSNLSFNGGAGLSLDNNAANSASLINTELNHNNIGVFIGTGGTVRMARAIVMQNTTNFSNNGTIVTSCNNETDSLTFPGVVSTNCIK